MPNYKYHTKTIEECLIFLNSREEGLSNTEASKRLKENGENSLPEGKKDSILKIFFRQFQNALIYILFGASVIIFLTGESVDAFVIFVVLLFNAIIGATQEGKAQNTLSALKKIVETKANVIRDNKEIIINDIDIVVGDIITIQEGEKVPADARIINANNLTVDESSLTGESGGILKNNSIIKEEVLAIADQKNMLFKGTHILNGNARALVVATGISTEIGKIAQKISSIDTEIPLKANMRYLSRIIMVVVSVIALLLMILGIFYGKSFKEMFVTTVALSVSIIPEGLPVVITLVLATGVKRMSKNKVLIKKLQAVEALGQTKIIAVDKTGTLTKNEMMVRHIYSNGKDFEITGDGYEYKGDVILGKNIVDPFNHKELILAAKIASFCSNAKISFSENNSWRISGDPTEAAMTTLAEKIGIHTNTFLNENPKIFELPFDYKKRYKATIRSVDGKNFLAVTGAPEILINVCQKIWAGDKTRHMDEENRSSLLEKFHNLANKGMRVIAYALNEDDKIIKIEDPLPSLAFVGFFGIEDSLRVEARESVEKVRDAGMKVVMITGDHSKTALSVAKEVGIWQKNDKVLTGEEIDSMSEKEFSEKIKTVSVFARVNPNHKLKIIEAYRKGEETVAMTGDGVNDSPSLVAADLGIAMGKIGTEVTKEASDIILLDDNFANIVKAAEEGRNIYKTIKKVILYLFSTSLGEVFVIASSIILGLPMPLVAVQIIWLNFVTDGFLDVALAMEPKEKDLMYGKFEKPDKWIVNREMIQRMFIMATPMAFGTIYLFQKYFNLENIKESWTIALTTMAVFQWLNAWNCRSDKKSIFKTNPFSNIFLVGATALVICLQILAVYNPFMQKILHTTEINKEHWIMIILISLSIIVVEEIRKIFYRKNEKQFIRA